MNLLGKIIYGIYIISRRIIFVGFIIGVLVWAVVGIRIWRVAVLSADMHWILTVASLVWLGVLAPWVLGYFAGIAICRVFDI